MQDIVRGTAAAVTTFGLGVGVLATAGLVGAAPLPQSAPARPASAPTVDVVADGQGVTASVEHLRPGNVVFSVAGGRAGGSVVLVRLKRSYSLHRLVEDFAEAFSGRTGPVRRMAHGARFYGGVLAPAGRGTSTFAVSLPRGRYHLLDLADGGQAPLRVAGSRTRRALPVTTGTARFTGHRIALPGTMANAGWLRLRNRGTEVSLMDLVHARPGTTRREVRRYFASRGREPGDFLLGPADGVLLLSPGRSMLWRYSLARGPAVAASSWPSEDDAVRQEYHGVWGMTRLRG